LACLLCCDERLVLQQRLWLVALRLQPVLRLDLGPGVSDLDIMEQLLRLVLLVVVIIAVIHWII